MWSDASSDEMLQLHDFMLRRFGLTEVRAKLTFHLDIDPQRLWESEGSLSDKYFSLLDIVNKHQWCKLLAFCLLTEYQDSSLAGALFSKYELAGLELCRILTQFKLTEEHAVSCYHEVKPLDWDYAPPEKAREGRVFVVYSIAKAQEHAPQSQSFADFMKAIGVYLEPPSNGPAIRALDAWWRKTARKLGLNDDVRAARAEPGSPTDRPERARSDSRVVQSSGFHEAESDDRFFSASISDHMATLNRHVERLTEEQQRVIQQLRGMRRVRIAGCAGSGKTLVAAEKAIRLCYAGLRTLFLCHNPLLAEHVRHLTLGSGVHVETFGEWVARLAGESGKISQEEWSNFEEPTPRMLEQAFDAVVGRDMYDAAIVDEGQDFRAEWWTVVEASLTDPNAGTLYIFHDELQAVLPYRAQYPIREPVLDLSRNCRNAGKIYELIRRLLSQAPEPDENLKDLGRVLLITYEQGKGREAIERAVRWFDRLGQLESVVTLLSGAHSLDASSLSRIMLANEQICWQAEVRSEFQRAMRIATTLKLPSGGGEFVEANLNRLGTGSYPSPEDIELVRSVAASFKVNPEIRRRILHNPRARARMIWAVRDGRLALLKPGKTSQLASWVIMHFEQEGWHRGIPKPKPIRFIRNSEPRDPGAVPVYSVGAFKGLEADAVLFHLEGSLPISKEEFYVGISRARMFLALIVETQALKALPAAFRALFQNNELSA